MNDKPQTNFECYRIRQLLDQYSYDKHEVITIIFGTLFEEARLDYSTWSVSNIAYKQYKASGFFNLMQHLLDIFIQYKAQNQPANSYNCILRINRGEINMEWVSETIAKNVIKAIHEKNNVDS